MEKNEAVTSSPGHSCRGEEKQEARPEADATRANADQRDRMEEERGRAESIFYLKLFAIFKLDKNKNKIQRNYYKKF